MGVILGVIGIIVLLAAVWYFALGPGSSPSTTTNTNNNTINPPAASSRPRGARGPVDRTQLPIDQSGHLSVTINLKQRCGVGTQPLVLVADDEPRITKLVSIALSEEGFRVVTATGGEDALAKAEEIRPDIVLLDIVMPDLDGIEVMRQLREQRPVPVILLTAKGATADKAKGLDLGADDYIAKPFHPDELAARVRAVIRRSSGVEPGAGVLAFDDIEIDLERRMVRRNGELVQLSRTEWLLLQHLATHPGKVVLHTELLTKVWGPEYRDDLQYLRVWISRVRRKLGAKPGEPGRIKTFQGIGYLLDVDGPGQPKRRRHRRRPSRDVGARRRRPPPSARSTRRRPSADAPLTTDIYCKAPGRAPCSCEGRERHA